MSVSSKGLGSGSEVLRVLASGSASTNVATTGWRGGQVPGEIIPWNKKQQSKDDGPH